MHRNATRGGPSRDHIDVDDIHKSRTCSFGDMLADRQNLSQCSRFHTGVREIMIAQLYTRFVNYICGQLEQKVGKTSTQK